MRSFSVFFVIVAFAASARAQREGPSLALGGDVLYEAPLAYQIRARAEVVGVREAYREVFVDLAETMGRADLAIANLEVPIGERLRAPGFGELPTFAAPPELLDGLLDAGVDAVTLANNHAYDQGAQGLANTLRATTRRALPAIGAGADRVSAAGPVVLRAGDASIAICAWTEGTNQRLRPGEPAAPRIAFMRDATVVRCLDRARASHLAIAFFHWTHEAGGRPREFMRAAATEAANAGADLVVGHGTHIPGPTDEIETLDGRRVPVLYSLGNLLATMEAASGELESEEAGVRDAPIALVRTAWRGERLAIAQIVWKHHWITRPTGEMPWMEGGRVHVSRPLALDREFDRITRARCGAPCSQRARAYRRRRELVNRALARLGAPIGAAEIEETTPIPAVAAEHAIRVEFREGETRERTIDEDAIGAIVRAMRDDRTLHADIVANASNPSLAGRRARRVMGLIAIRGPSRTRFSLRAEAGDPGLVRVHLHR